MDNSLRKLSLYIQRDDLQCGGGKTKRAVQQIKIEPHSKSIPLEMLIFV
jgi:hypothetical protein